jgi:TonB family protein
MHVPAAAATIPSSRSVVLSNKLCALPLALVLLMFPPLHAEDRMVTRKVPPAYPAIAKQSHITGVIKVSATADASGAVVSADSSSGNKVLAKAAMEAVKQWKFAPGAATTTINVEITFQ